MIGKQQINSTSRSLAPEATFAIIEAILLFLTGAFAIFLHARLRLGINIPGHHGIHFMALLMAGRMISKVRFSSVFMALGIGVMILLPFMGFKNPISAMGYMLPVLTLDLIYSTLPEKMRKTWILAFVGGFSYLMVPLFRLLLMTLAGIAYPSALKFGSPLVPVAGFLLFGLIGSGITVGIVKISKRYRK